ncbi:MAG: hypothetical protein J6B43_00980 [Lachnospiraceae bacterium]|nr:hypothetical protein [Lachnospiraceae bacterium]
MKGKQKGSVLDFMTVGLCILALAVVLTAYFACSDLLLRKGQISQIARCYILKMETMGCLTEGEKNNMLAELQAVGLQAIDLTGTTMNPVEYGDCVILQIRGRIQASMWREDHDLFQSVFTAREVPVEERRMSTAKH